MAVDAVDMQVVEVVQGGAWNAGHCCRRHSCESASNPRMVFVIHHNIYIIQLLAIQKNISGKVQFMYNNWVVNLDPSNCKGKVLDKASRHHLYLSDSRSQ